MTVPATNRNLSRLIEFGAIAVVIATPITLIAATWQPLEPEPRPGRINSASLERPAEDAASPTSASDGKTEKHLLVVPDTHARATPPS